MASISALCRNRPVQRLFISAACAPTRPRVLACPRHIFGLLSRRAASGSPFKGRRPSRFRGDALDSHIQMSLDNLNQPSPHDPSYCERELNNPKVLWPFHSLFTRPMELIEPHVDQGFHSNRIVHSWAEDVVVLLRDRLRRDAKQKQPKWSTSDGKAFDALLQMWLEQERNKNWYSLK